MRNREFDRDRPRQPALPKPYGFVSLPDQRPQLGQPIGHERYHEDRCSGTITGTLIARSDIHVASGLLERRTQDRKHPLVKAHMRSNGRPVIPATSLKGCFRSIVEAISPSAVHVTKANFSQQDTSFKRRSNIVAIDPSARLFGAQGYLGSVAFGDAVLEEGETTVTTTPQLYSPRPDAYGAYYDGGRIKGRKFYQHGKRAEGSVPLEVCRSKSRFSLTIHFENLTDGELGLLLTALGISEPQFCPKLGGGKPACLGTLEVHNLRLQLLHVKESYTDFDSQAQASNIEVFLTASREENLVLSKQLEKLATLLHWPNEEHECPDRMY